METKIILDGCILCDLEYYRWIFLEERSTTKICGGCSRKLYIIKSISWIVK